MALLRRGVVAMPAGGPCGPFWPLADRLPLWIVMAARGRSVVRGVAAAFAIAVAASSLCRPVALVDRSGLAASRRCRYADRWPLWAVLAARRPVALVDRDGRSWPIGCPRRRNRRRNRRRGVVALSTGGPRRFADRWSLWIGRPWLERPDARTVPAARLRPPWRRPPLAPCR